MSNDNESQYEHMRIKKQRELDEFQTYLSDNIPRLWYTLYTGLITQGFEKDQAFSLLKCYILKDGANGVNVHKD